MSSVALVVCEALSQADQITNGLLWLVRHINGGGEFFSHAVFSALASVAVSSRLRDFIIAPSGESIQALKSDIEQEINKVTRCAQIDDDLQDRLRGHYQHCINDADDLLSQLKKDVAEIEKTCHVRCWVFFAVIFILISVRVSEHLGAINLLCLIPLWRARRSMSSTYESANRKLEELRNNFNNVRTVCQSQYEKDQDDMVARIQTELAPEGPAKRT